MNEYYILRGFKGPRPIIVNGNGSGGDVTVVMWTAVTRTVCWASGQHGHTVLTNTAGRPGAGPEQPWPLTGALAPTWSPDRRSSVAVTSTVPGQWAHGQAVL